MIEINISHIIVDLAVRSNYRLVKWTIVTMTQVPECEDQSLWITETSDVRNQSDDIRHHLIFPEQK